jgi:hypothetical protein
MNDDEGIPALVRKAEAERVNAELKRAVELRQSYGINFYRPHYKQHLFHSSSALHRYLRTGNRFGKSECGICEDIAHCLGGRSWYRCAFDILDGEKNVRLSHPGGLNHPLITQGIPQHPVKGLILVVDWEMAKKIFTNRDGSPARRWIRCGSTTGSLRPQCEESKIRPKA